MTETVWGIHAGQHGEADSLFLKHGVIAIGWSGTGDLGTLPAQREAFRQRLVETHPETKPGAVAGTTGVLYRFVHEIHQDDLVVYPSNVDRSVHIGRVVGAYVHDPAPNSHYPHHRAVKWLKTVPRIHFSQGALYEMGSAITLFQIRNHDDEARAAVAGKTETPKVDETVGVVAEEIEQATRDFVLKRLSTELKGHPLAHFVAHLLGTMGYRTRVSAPGPDAGIDIVAHKDELGFEPPIVKAQIKSSTDNVGAPEVQALYGTVAASEFGLLVTLGGFTPAALTFARGKSNLRLVDGNELVNITLRHYEELDSRYKGLIPLRHVYVPEPLEDEE